MFGGKVPVSTTYGPVLETSAPELRANIAGGAAVAHADASIPGVLMVTGDSPSAVGMTLTDPSISGVMGEPTSSGCDEGPASVEGGSDAEIDPAEHPVNAPARRQIRIFLVD
jgi:hypothetical protein